MAFSNKIVFAIASTLLLSACATLPTRSVDLGTKALEPVAGGQAVSVRDLTAPHEATVFVWWSTTCPCAARYEKRVLDLRARYPEERLGVYAIVSNADETIANAHDEAIRRGFDVPMYFDAGARVANTFRIRSTPTVVLFDQAGEPRFTGWIDNEREPGERGREAWLDDALEALFAGRDDFQRKTPTWGCPLTRSLSDDIPDCCRMPATN